MNVGPLLDSNLTHDASHSSGDANFNYNKTTIRCHACKPGFRPSKQNMAFNGKTYTLGLLVTACTAIANCENSTWFNGCSQCQAGFAHPYTNNRTNFGECVAVPAVQKECWAFDTVAQRCMLCKKGTYLNKDYVCELINTPNCQPREFRFNQIYTF